MCGVLRLAVWLKTLNLALLGRQPMLMEKRGTPDLKFLNSLSFSFALFFSMFSVICDVLCVSFPVCLMYYMF